MTIKTRIEELKKGCKEGCFLCSDCMIKICNIIEDSKKEGYALALKEVQEIADKFILHQTKRDAHFLNKGRAELLKDVEKIIDKWYNTSPCDGGGNCKICKCRDFVKNELKNIDVSNSLKQKIQELERLEEKNGL